MSDNQTPVSETSTATARRVLRCAHSGSLATLKADTAAPFASRVIVATDSDGTPLLLLSNLAVHTQNLKNDPRACLLLSNESGGDPMRDARISVNGRIATCDAARTRRRFLARHPEAAGYADFADFSFYRLVVEDTHLVADFGRIHTIAARDLLLDVSGAEELITAEAGIVEHMNDDHADALVLYATRLLGAADGQWTMTGCDPEGIDLSCGIDSRRLIFDTLVFDPGALRKQLVTLAATARER